MLAIFNSSEVKTYTRTDNVEGVRYGFIAQDVKSQLPSDISNIVFETRAPVQEGEDTAKDATLEDKAPKATSKKKAASKQVNKAPVKATKKAATQNKKVTTAKKK